MKKLSYGIPIITRKAIYDFCGESKECFTTKSFNIEFQSYEPVTRYVHNNSIFSTQSGHEEVMKYETKIYKREIQFDICPDCIRQLNNFCMEENRNE